MNTPDQRCVAAGGVVLDQIDESSQPLVLQVIWQLLIETGGLSAVASRVDEGVGMIESGFVVDP